MKIITTTNWVLISLYAILLVFTLFNINRSGNDAAGRGMESGFLFIGIILLAGLVGLNLMPYRATKITALVLAGLPLIIVLYNFLSDYFMASHQQHEDNT
ncbi:hypothetical protein ACFSUS_26675 [Spirosoma soli]|uniref:Uncharacterized protein n=1 Tax=Spirosoma soli TaxID=1770529 RepID=A0ABW5MB01_9BACT